MQKLFLGLCALVLSFNFLPTFSTGAISACHDVEAIFARGSGGELDTDANFVTFKTNLLAATENFSGFSLSITDLDYPAVSIANLFTPLGAIFDLSEETADYYQSVNSGIEKLSNTIKTTLKACPNTKFVLAGYSQGAEVVSTAIYQGKVPADSLVYAATFGDPKIYFPEGRHLTGTVPDACRGKNLSNYRVAVPNCYTEHGFLGANIPYQTSDFIDKIGTWCNGKDLFCGAGFKLSGPLDAHLAYSSDGSYQQAANIIAKKLAALFPSKVSGSVGVVKAPMDTAILIDSTGSMSELIDRYRTEAKRLANKTYAAGGRVALYEYRDLKDPFDARQLCDFSCTPEQFEERLNNITVDGGGDGPESALSASLKVINTLKWQHGATKSVVLLTDAGYLSPDRDGTTLTEVFSRSLEIDPVNFYFIVPSNKYDTYSWWAGITGGKVFSSADEFSVSTDFLMNRPVAALALENYVGAPGEEFVFDASGSTVENIDHFEWDLDFDGVFKYNSGTNPVITHTFPAETSGFMQVKVVSTTGEFSTMSAHVTVSNSAGDDAPSLSNLTSTISGNDADFSFNKSANTALTLVSVNDRIAGYLTDTTFSAANLSADKETNISFIPVSTTGRTGEPLSATVIGTGVKAETKTKSSSSPIIPLKAPNAGYHY